MAFRTLQASSLPAADAYRILVNVITPRPIALVSTISAGGAPNLAPFSYFQLGGSNPPSLMISPTLTREGGEKDTLANIKATGEFVVNIVNRAMVEQMNATSARLAPGENEWSLTCFTPEKSLLVRPDRVEQSPVQLECKVFQIVNHGEANYVIGEVVAFHLEEQYLDGDRPLGEKLRTVGRMGGDLYIDTGIPELFRLARPSA
jgi:flavin reductase (DIM6/NTAB) family NADH-FMN oxidoreductase RutF